MTTFSLRLRVSLKISKEKLGIGTFILRLIRFPFFLGDAKGTTDNEGGKKVNP